MGSDAIYEAVGPWPRTLAYPGGAYNTAVMDAVPAKIDVDGVHDRVCCSASWFSRFTNSE